MKKLLFLGVIFLLLFSFLVGVSSFSDLRNSLSSYSEKAQSISSVFQSVISKVVSLFTYEEPDKVVITEEDKDDYKDSSGSYYIDKYYKKYTLKYYDKTFEVRTIAKMAYNKFMLYDEIRDEVVIYSTCPNILVDSRVSDGIFGFKFFEWLEDENTMDKMFAPWNYEEFKNPDYSGVIDGNDRVWVDS